MSKVFSVDFRRSVNDQYGALATFGSTATISNDEKGLALRAKSLATDYISYGNIAAINSIGTGAFSFVVGANIKGFLNHGSVYNILSGKGFIGGTMEGFSMGVGSTGDIFVFYIGTSNIISTIKVNSKNSLAIVTRDASGNCKLYINGVLSGTPISAIATIAGTQPMGIGYGGQITSRTPNASIYLSEVYNHCLSQQEIDNLVADFNARTIISKPIRGFITTKPTDLARFKGTGPTQGLLRAYNCLPKNTVLVDISGNLGNGVVTNCITTKDGMLLSGVSSKVVLGNIGNVKSITFRIKPLSATAKIMEKAANSGLIYNNSGTLVAADFANIYVNGMANAAFATNQWQNICLTSATDVNFSACALGLNNTTYGAFEIADLIFWNKTLSLQEAKDYNNSFVRPVLTEDFSANAADGQIKTPNQWVKGTGAGKVLELASAVSVRLPKGRKYFEFSTIGNMSIPIMFDPNNISIEYDYYNGSAWEKRTGDRYTPGIICTSNKLTVYGDKIGDRFTNLLVHNGSKSDNEYPSSYGVIFDTASTSPILTRIGNLTYHQTLPIQSLIRGCVLTDSGTVSYYLKSTDWTKKIDETSSNLDGTDGQVMIELPAHYRIFTTVGTVKTVRISFDPLPGYHLVPKMYISAYEASIDRVSGKLSSIVNMGVNYRGGNNTSAWDATYRSLLGRPVTNISRTAFRTAARLRNADTKWNCLDYNAYKSLEWLYFIEYANTNSQLPINATLDSNGYKQGGLGNGVTTWDATWGTWNTYNPFVPCGYTNSLGNGSGEVAYAIKDTDGITTIKTVYANRYRGVELPYGHIWKWMDGINIEVGATESKVYVADNPANYSAIGYTGYTNRGLLARASGYISKMILGEFGEIMPSEASGGSTTGFCDYLYNNTTVSLRGVLASGASVHGAECGFSIAGLDAVSTASTLMGSRLCYIP